MPVLPEKWVIGFHERHGRNITLTNGNQRAVREGDTYDHGMVFSDRPLHIGEVFQLKIEELESKWAGSLRFGITTNNPNCHLTRVVRAATDLFTPEGQEYWMLSGTRIHNGEIEKEYSFSIHSLKVNDVLGVQVLSTGDLIYYVNGVPQGIAISGIPVRKDIFAVFDVYGRTKQVSLKYFGDNKVLPFG
ncbi:neuralized-like protein 4 isoform X2 [Orbicella faveolata]|uniref:neuralized-like protein 4 isoform X2 n=1 Tax=Orbicella faveolata TaxID=48498 RepID=UPI0009E31808|nr:neuralized-like protein 4 isoform X2 [Orbicella faveolata]